MSSLRIESSPTGVVTLTLDRAERKNAMDIPMFAELGDAWMAAGFGGLQIAFGLWIARHPDG